MNTSAGLHSTQMPQHRFHLLDALRGVAAILVVLWHMPSFIYPQSTHSSFLAVDFFFCLSGFVIAFSYERRLQSVISLRDFVAARFIRLYPTYLLGLLLGFIVYLRFFWHHATPLVPVRHLALLIVTQLFMLPDYFIRILPFAFPFNDPAWSLFFEMVANVAYAILVRLDLAKTWHLLVLILISFAVLLSYALPFHLDVGWSNQPPQQYLGLARVTLSFLIGVLTLRLYRIKPQIITGRGLHFALALLLPTVLIAALHSPLSTLRTDTFLFTDLLIVFPATVYLGAHIKVPQACIPLCAFLGDTSYPLYLLHVPLLIPPAIIFSRIFYSPQAQHPVVPSLARYLFLVGVTALCLAISKLAVRFFDTPVRNFLKRRFNLLSGLSLKFPPADEAQNHLEGLEQIAPQARN